MWRMWSLVSFYLRKFKRNTYKSLREIKESFWCCENCFGLAMSMFEAGIHATKQHMKKTMEDIKKSASRDHQQTTNEIKSVKTEVNAVKDTCKSVQESKSTDL